MTPFELLLQRFAEMVLDGIERIRRKKLAIRQFLEPIAVSGDSGKFFHVTVPWRNVLVANGPVDREAIPGRAFEIVLAPALGLPGPKKRPAAHLVTANPVEGLFLNVRMLVVFDEEMV